MDDFNAMSARNEQSLSQLKDESSRKASAFNDLREIRMKEEEDAVLNRMKMRDSVEAAVASTPEGGMLSPAQISYLNASRGIEGRNGEVVDGQIMEGGWNPKTGGYGFTIAKAGPDGSIGYSRREMPMNELYGMMRSRPEYFSEQQTANLGAAIQKADPSFTTSRLDGLASSYAARGQDLQTQLDRARGVSSVDQARANYYNANAEYARGRGDGSRSGQYFDRNAAAFLKEFMGTPRGTEMFQNVKTMDDVADLFVQFNNKVRERSAGGGGNGGNGGNPVSGGDIVRGALGGGAGQGGKQERTGSIRKTGKPVPGVGGGSPRSGQNVRTNADVKRAGERAKRILMGNLTDDGEAEDFVTKHYDPIVKDALSDEKVSEWLNEHSNIAKINAPLSKQDPDLVKSTKERLLTDAINKYNEENGIDRRNLGEYGLRQMIYDRYGLDISDDAFQNEVLMDDNGKVKSAHWYTGTSSSEGPVKPKKGLPKSRTERMNAKKAESDFRK